jgi:hypothetical protein
MNQHATSAGGRRQSLINAAVERTRNSAGPSQSQSTKKSATKKLSEYEQFLALSSPSIDGTPLPTLEPRSAALKARQSIGPIHDHDPYSDESDDWIDAVNKRLPPPVSSPFYGLTPSEELTTIPRKREGSSNHRRSESGASRRRDSTNKRQSRNDRSVEDNNDEDDVQNQITRQFKSEYEQFQALASPDSSIVLGKRPRKPAGAFREAAGLGTAPPRAEKTDVARSGSETEMRRSRSEQFRSEYEQYQALASPDSGIVLGKRPRKPAGAFREVAGLSSGSGSGKR